MMAIVKVGGTIIAQALHLLSDVSVKELEL